MLCVGKEAGLDWLRKHKSKPLGLTLGPKISLRFAFCFTVVLEFPLQGMNEDANEKRNAWGKENHTNTLQCNPAATEQMS